MEHQKRQIPINEIRERLDDARIRLVQCRELGRLVHTAESNKEKTWTLAALANREHHLLSVIEDCNKMIRYHREQTESENAVNVLRISGKEPIDLSAMAFNILRVDK